jgi:multicomponent Na+:H+ antiporter subunit G
MISEWIAGILIILGSLFMLIASIGMVKLPDLYMRIHAATKAPTLGILLMAMGVLVYFFELWASVEGVIVILFVFITTPVASHMISRVAHTMGVKKTESTIIDEMDTDKENSSAESDERN